MSKKCKGKKEAVPFESASLYPKKSDHLNFEPFVAKKTR